MIHNNKVYANADEKFVKGTIIYSNNMSVLFHDVELTKPVMKDELKDIFLNGAIIKDEDEYITPVMYTISDGNAVVEIANSNMYSATTPTEE